MLNLKIVQKFIFKYLFESKLIKKQNLNDKNNYKYFKIALIF